MFYFLSTTHLKEHYFINTIQMDAIGTILTVNTST